MATVKVKPTPRDLDQYYDFFNEAAYMGGTHVRYQAINEKVITDLSSEMYTWQEPIHMDIIYDERPKVSLLKRLNWYTEDTTIQPRIMYLPTKVSEQFIEVRRGDLVHVPNPLNRDEDDVFQVSEVRTDLVPLMFVCNIVPFRKQIRPEGSERNNKWLDV